MEWEFVISSNLMAFKYEKDTLFIMFKDDSIYEYYSVPLKIYLELQNAESYGKYHAVYIKNNYACKRIK